MSPFVLLPTLLVCWLFFAVVRKEWRLTTVLCFVALLSGCGSTSNRFDKSPCACDFQPLNTGNYKGTVNA